jgi:hypothetical protein
MKPVSAMVEGKVILQDSIEGKGDARLITSQSRSHAHPSTFMLADSATPEVVERCYSQGMFAFHALFSISHMQLIQIGEIKQKTVLDLVQEMAARQFAEIEQLKRTRLSAAGVTRNVRRRRCTSQAAR